MSAPGHICARIARLVLRPGHGVRAIQCNGGGGALAEPCMALRCDSQSRLHTAAGRHESDRQQRTGRASLPAHGPTNSPTADSQCAFSMVRFGCCSVPIQTRMPPSVQRLWQWQWKPHSPARSLIPLPLGKCRATSLCDHSSSPRRVALTALRARPGTGGRRVCQWRLVHRRVRATGAEC